MQKIKHRLRDLFSHFLLINDTPHRIAAGFGLGIFFGVIPGLGILATVFFTAILGLNEIAALAGVLGANLWLTVVLLPLAAGIGGFLFDISSQELINQFELIAHKEWQLLFSKTIFFEIALPLLVGFFITALAVALLCYLFLYLLLKNHKVEIH